MGSLKQTLKTLEDIEQVANRLIAPVSSTRGSSGGGGGGIRPPGGIGTGGADRLDFSQAIERAIARGLAAGFRGVASSLRGDGGIGFRTGDIR